MKRIEDYAKKGEHRDEMKALRLLTEAYIDMCGVSLGFRTVVYCAAEAWVERLAWLDLPLSEMARKEPLVCLMPHITDLYKPEIYDRYDIAGMGDPELLAACRQIIVEKTFDEATTEVLCWGILKATEEKEELSQEVEATAMTIKAKNNAILLIFLQILNFTILFSCKNTKYFRQGSYTIILFTVFLTF